MFSLCRLCAKCTESTESVIELSELKSKLVMCCGWQPAENEVRMPQKACCQCVEKLQKCWEFAESVWAAEKQLNKLATEPDEVWFSELSPLNEPFKLEQTEVEQKIDCSAELDESKCEIDDDDDVDVFGEPIAYSDAESVHSDGKLDKSEEITSAEKKQLSKDPFLAVLAPEDCLEGGLISNNGIAKLEKLYPDMKTISWNDCQYKCVKCNRIFNGPHNFYAHIRSIHMAEVITIKVFCFYCNSKHRREYALNRHIAMEHFTHLKYRCAHCSNYYWNTRELSKHRNMHTDVEYKCELCEQIFTNREALYAHISLAHFKKKKDEPVEKFTCDICSKDFSTKSGIRSHLLLHTKRFDYICDQCGWKFQSKGNLKGHLASTHSTERPFKCGVCDKSFKTKPQMRNHAKHHDDIRPHVCAVCGRTFRRPYTLTVHMRSHTNTCPYTCRFCGKSFRHNITLQTHERAHTSDKPYACTNCEYRSTSKGNLNKHMMRVHSIDFRNHVYQRET